MSKKIISTVVGCLCMAVAWASPATDLLERIDKGASRKFVIELQSPASEGEDFFELDQRGHRVVVHGNSWVSIATGINWYLKYYAGIHLSWNCMQAKLPRRLPPVPVRERRSTRRLQRYYLNYCTHSYSMAFWDWERWEKEIDWMAMHGINLPLAITGSGALWRNLLTRLGYTPDEVNDFVAGPAYQAWWLMNNLEGGGGPNPPSWYSDQEKLQQRILKRMRSYGMQPVLPGYAGMVPANAAEKLHLSVADPGRWCGYRRPAFLQPTDSNFARIASLYYEEQRKLYGRAYYYSIDPFHEGGNTAGVDLAAAGEAIVGAMKQANPNAVWVAQAWQQCPHPAMIEPLQRGDLLVLDLFSESRPQWGDPQSPWYREKGFLGHPWVFCMLLNFGGNVGLYGKMEQVAQSYRKACASPFGNSLSGVGLTMEGIENNPVMYELLCELPWREEGVKVDEWLRSYVRARYGKESPGAQEAWAVLKNSVYNCPTQQEGTNESIFCARPSLNAYQVSSWSGMRDYYSPQDVTTAARLMLSAAAELRGNDNFEYDLVDVVRQAVAEEGRLTLRRAAAAHSAGRSAQFESEAERFLQLIVLQDSLLASRREFCLGSWTESARAMGHNEAESDLYEWNARRLLTTWGDRNASDRGGLHDYAHREWSGLLRDLYLLRWSTLFAALKEGRTADSIDFYAIEEEWTRQHNRYSPVPQGDAVERARRAMEFIIRPTTR